MDVKVYRKIVSSCRKLSGKGLVSGTGGNISVKKNKKVYITSTGSSFSEIEKNNICSLNLSGENISGDKIKPSCEWKMHLQCYNSNPEVKSVVHTHPVFATLIGVSSGKEVSVSYELISCFNGSDITKIKYFPPGSKKLAREIGSKIETHFEGIILAGHGLLTVGENIDKAVEKSIVLERESIRWIGEKILKKLELVDEDILSSLEHRLKI